MIKLSNRITGVSCLKNELDNGLVCLTDVNNIENAEHTAITRNIDFIELHFGDMAVDAFENKSEQCSRHELVVFDVLLGKAVVMIPTLYTGYAQRLATFEPPASYSDKSVDLLDFEKGNFIDNKGNKATLIHTFEGQEYSYVFSLDNGKEDAVKQVNSKGVTRKGKAKIFNVTDEIDLNEVEGYIVLQSDFEPMFISKGCKSPTMPNKSLTLPSVAYRDDNGNLLSLVVLANLVNEEF